MVLQKKIKEETSEEITAEITDEFDREVRENHDFYEKRRKQKIERH
ncbi:hypothetical protein [Ruminiclostridium hungatei]|nr:hypothetical protein [Ruminiclostridium hungatei]